MKLYEIIGEEAAMFEEIEALIAEGAWNDDIAANAAKALEDIAGEKTDKLLIYARVVKNERAFQESIKEEKRKLDKKLKTSTRKTEFMLGVMKDAIPLGKKYKDAAVSISTRKTTRVVLNIEPDMYHLLPDDWVKVTILPNKTAIKKSMDENPDESFGAAHIEEGYSVTIK